MAANVTDTVSLNLPPAREGIAGPLGRSEPQREPAGDIVHAVTGDQADRDRNAAASAADYLRHAQQKSGRSPMSLVREFFRLHRGRGKLSLAEYVQYRVYETNYYSPEQQVRFITNMLHWPITRQCCDMTWQATTEDKWLCTHILARTGVEVPETLAVIDRTDRAYPGTRKISTAAELREFLTSPDFVPLFGKENRGICSFGAFIAEGADDFGVRLAGQRSLPYDDFIRPLRRRNALSPAAPPGEPRVLRALYRPSCHRAPVPPSRARGDQDSFRRAQAAGARQPRRQFLAQGKPGLRPRSRPRYGCHYPLEGLDWDDRSRCASRNWRSADWKLAAYVGQGHRPSASVRADLPSRALPVDGHRDYAGRACTDRDQYGRRLRPAAISDRRGFPHRGGLRVLPRVRLHEALIMPAGVQQMQSTSYAPVHGPRPYGTGVLEPPSDNTMLPLAPSASVYDAEAIPDSARAEIAALLSTGDLFRYRADAGSPVARLEREFAAFMGVPFALAVNSCSSALFLALRALNIPSGGRVLLPAFTFAAVPSSVVHAGGVPVLVEVGEDYRINLGDFSAKLEEGTAAVLISHMRGHTSDMDAIMRLSEERNVPVVEDAAHSLGTLWSGRKIGTIGKLGCFSFQSFKLVNAGEGGMLITADPDLIARAVIMSGAYEHNWKKHPVAHERFRFWQNRLPLYNLRMNNLSAAVARSQIAEVPRRVRDGRGNHDYVAAMLNMSDWLSVPPPLDKEERAPDSIQFNLLGFRADDEAIAFQRAANERGVAVQIFGLSEDNARAFWNWQFIGRQSTDLTQTRRMLMRACDVRLPAWLRMDELNSIASALIKAAEDVKGARSANPQHLNRKAHPNLDRLKNGGPA